MEGALIKMRLQSGKEVVRSGILFTVAYMVSYITRINFGAVISEMETATGITRDLLSMSVTGSFITYGVGQVLSGVLGDKVSPKRLISLGFAITTVMNLLIPLCNSPYLMLGVWCINGFAQSLMWPPLVKIMTTYLSQRDYEKVSVWVLWGGSLGTIFIYLISPVMIAILSWKAVFVFAGVCGGLMLALWNKFAVDVDIRNIEKPEKQKKSLKFLFAPVMVLIMVAIIIQGMLKDGVTTWMPTYISDTYGLSNVISILTGVIIPLFTMIMNKLFASLYRRVLTNPVTCAGAIFAIGGIFALGIFLTSGRSAIASVVLTALLVGSMHGVNLMLICMVPSFFKKYGNVSTVSGIINACTYIGSALSTYGIAVLSQKVGWSSTVLMWTLFAVVGTVICVLCARAWRNYING